MPSLKICQHCGEEFELKPGKPGLINECPAHSHETTEKKGGVMIWDHKTAPTLEVKSMRETKRIVGLMKRIGAGVTRSITQSREPHLKEDEGAAPGAVYYSKMGEKRTVKL